MEDTDTGSKPETSGRQVQQKSIIDSFNKATTTKVTERQQQINRDFIIWLSMDLLPFSLLSNPGFQYFFSKHVPHVNIPDESTLRKTYVDEVYSRVAVAVKTDLARANVLNVMFDGWTDKHNAAHYIGLRVQYIDVNWDGRVATLSVKRCGQDAESISNHVMQELDTFIPDYKQKTVFSTHDGASTMLKVSRLLKVKDWQHCVAHAINLLLMGDSLQKVPDVIGLIRKCKDIVNELHYKCDMLESEVKDTNNETAARNLLQKINEIELREENGIVQDGESELEDLENHVDPLDTSVDTYGAVNKMTTSVGAKRVYRLKQEMPTRWNSCLMMLRSLCQMRKEIDNCLKLIGRFDKCLKGSEWSTVEELTNFLSHFEELTELVSTKVTSLSLIYLVRKEIIDVCSVKPADCEEVAMLKRRVCANVDKRLPLTDAVVLATLLDPSTKGLLDKSHDEKAEILFTGINNMENPETSLTQTQASSTQEPSIEPEEIHVSKRRKLLLKHRAQPSSDDSAREEINRYLQEQPPGEVDENPLLFWKRAHYKHLAPLAREVMTRSASSVDVECMFSTMGLILNGKRSRLSSQRADRLCFIHDNISYLDLSKIEGSATA